MDYRQHAGRREGDADPLEKRTPGVPAHVPEHERHHAQEQSQAGVQDRVQGRIICRPDRQQDAARERNRDQDDSRRTRQPLFRGGLAHKLTA